MPRVSVDPNCGIRVQGIAADRPGEENTFKFYQLDVTLEPAEGEGEMDAPNPAVQPQPPIGGVSRSPMSDLRQGLRNCDTLII